MHCGFFQVFLQDGVATCVLQPGVGKQCIAVARKVREFRVRFRVRVRFSLKLGLVRFRSLPSSRCNTKTSQGVAVRAGEDSGFLIDGDNSFSEENWWCLGTHTRSGILFLQVKVALFLQK